MSLRAVSLACLVLLVAALAGCAGKDTADTAMPMHNQTQNRY